MAILTIGERLQAMDEFIAHWTALNAALAPSELALSGGYTLAGGFVPDREAVRQSQADVIARENALSIARAVRDELRGALSGRFKQFRAAVHAFLPESNYLVSIPKKPLPAASAWEWREACTEVATLWERIDANVPPVAGFVPPLLLAGGYARAQFAADADALQDAYENVADRTTDLRLAKALREEVYEGPRARMVQYRLAVLGTLEGGNALLATLPAVTPD